MRPGRAADHSPPSSAAVMEEESYTSTHPLGHTEPVTGSLYLFLYYYYMLQLLFYFAIVFYLFPCVAPPWSHCHGFVHVFALFLLLDTWCGFSNLVDDK